MQYVFFEIKLGSFCEFLVLKVTLLLQITIIAGAGFITCSAHINFVEGAAALPARPVSTPMIIPFHMELFSIKTLVYNRRVYFCLLSTYRAYLTACIRHFTVDAIYFYSSIRITTGLD